MPSLHLLLIQQIKSIYIYIYIIISYVSGASEVLEAR
jgi:hypothetical protein